MVKIEKYGCNTLTMSKIYYGSIEDFIKMS